MRTVLIGIPNYRRLIIGKAWELLVASGLRIVANPESGIAGRAFMAEHLPAADALIAGGETLNREALERAPSLRVIARYGVGTDSIDLAYARQRGICVTNTAGANANAVAEHAVMLMLCAMRRMRGYAFPAYSSAGEDFPELAGKTVGLIGFGRIGQMVMKRLSGFDVRTVVYDPYRTPVDIAAYGAESVSLDELLRLSDIVSLHLPYSKETDGMIGREQLERMKPDAVLINTARGALVDETALVSALRERRIAGAGLDVTRQEPVDPDNPLLMLPNIVLTPHVAGGSRENHEKAGLLCVEAVLDVLAGRTPRNQVLPAGGEPQNVKEGFVTHGGEQMQ